MRAEAFPIPCVILYMVNERRPMTRHYKSYTDQDILNNVPNVINMRQLLVSVGLQPKGGNYANMKRKLQQLGCDTSHWTGQAWNKDQQLKDWSEYTRASRLKPHLIRSRGHQCELCQLEEWLELPISLEIHHVDGDRTHNNPDNLQLLCPNCHATTDNWRNRK